MEFPNGKAPKGGCHYQGNVCASKGVEGGGFLGDFHFILFYLNLFYFILFLPLTSGNEDRLAPTDPLNSGHLWDHLFLPLSDDLPCRRLMVMESGCRKCHRDVHMVNSKFAKMGFLSSSEACYTSLNTLVGVHRDGNAKANLFICPVFLFHLCPFPAETSTSSF